MSRLHLEPKLFKHITDCANYNWSNEFDLTDSTLNYGISVLNPGMTSKLVEHKNGYFKYHVTGSFKKGGEYPTTWIIFFYNSNFNQYDMKVSIKITNNAECLLSMNYPNGSYFKSKDGGYSYCWGFDFRYNTKYQIPNNTYLGQTNFLIKGTEGQIIDTYVEIEVCKGYKSLITTNLNITNANDIYVDYYTREQLLELLKDLQDLKGKNTSLTLTMGSKLLALLTDEDKKIATDKGWTLA